MENCCQQKNKNKKGFLPGILYGIIPHTFCIAFLAMSLAGAAGVAAISKRFLIIPNFFLFLCFLSLSLATLAAILYLKKNNCLTLEGARKKYKYLITLYSATIITNLLIAHAIIPAMAQNIEVKKDGELERTAFTSLEVQIPCPGHAPLVISELERLNGIQSISFQTPDTFRIAYNPEKTSIDKIGATEIFKTFKIKNKIN